MLQPESFLGSQSLLSADASATIAAANRSRMAPRVAWKKARVRPSRHSCMLRMPYHCAHGRWRHSLGGGEFFPRFVTLSPFPEKAKHARGREEEIMRESPNTCSRTTEQCHASTVKHACMRHACVRVGAILERSHDACFARQRLQCAAANAK